MPLEILIRNELHWGFDYGFGRILQFFLIKALKLFAMLLKLFVADTLQLLWSQDTFGEHFLNTPNQPIAVNPEVIDFFNNKVLSMSLRRTSLTKVLPGQSIVKWFFYDTLY